MNTPTTPDDGRTIHWNYGLRGDPEVYEGYSPKAHYVDDPAVGAETYAQVAAGLSETWQMYSWGLVPKLPSLLCVGHTGSLSSTTPTKSEARPSGGTRKPRNQLSTRGCRRT